MRRPRDEQAELRYYRTMSTAYLTLEGVASLVVEGVADVAELRRVLEIVQATRRRAKSTDVIH